MNYSIILLLSLLIAANQDDIGHHYVIKTFIDYLQETHYYNLLYEIKCAFGEDVAIEFCLEFITSPHCEEVVRVYLPDCDRNRYLCNIREFIYKEEHLKIIEQNHTKEEIERSTKKLESKNKCDKKISG